MPIEPDKPPMESLQALKEMIETAPDDYGPMIGKVLADVPKHWPHQIYCAGLEDIAAAQGLHQAAPIGWRYLASSGSDRNYAIEVQLDSDGIHHHFAMMDKGPYIDAMYRLVHDKILAKEIGVTTFTPALLRINALALVAVWLRHTEPEKEIIIPLPIKLAPWKKYSTQQFLAKWKDVAQDKLDHEFSDG